MDELNQTRFLNVDLDIRSRSNLAPLRDELGENVCVLCDHNEDGLHTLSLEVSSELDQNCSETHLHDAELCIRQFICLIDALPAAILHLWNTAESKIFDIGFDSGTRPFPYCCDLTPGILEAVSRIGAKIRITIYPFKDNQPSATTASEPSS